MKTRWITAIYEKKFCSRYIFHVCLSFVRSFVAIRKLFSSLVTKIVCSMCAELCAVVFSLHGPLFDHSLLSMWVPSILILFFIRWCFFFSTLCSFRFVFCVLLLFAAIIYHSLSFKTLNKTVVCILCACVTCKRSSRNLLAKNYALCKFVNINLMNKDGRICQMELLCAPDFSWEKLETPKQNKYTANRAYRTIAFDFTDKFHRNSLFK